MRKWQPANPIRNVRRTPPAYPPEKRGSDAQVIKRIDEIIQNARTTWFALLGVLVFAGITLLGVKDIDFFAAQSETKLPLVGVSVPVEYFFWAGAALVTALYVYFHLYLELLWAALGKAPARIDDAPLSEHVSPWLVVEWALRYRDWLAAQKARRQERIAAAEASERQQPIRQILRAGFDWLYPGEPPERSATQRIMGWVGTTITLSLVWLFGLFVLFYFWWRSMPAHIDWMSLWLGLLFTFALWIAWRNWRAAKRLLDGRGSTWARSNFRTRVEMGVRTFSIFASLMVIMSSITLVRTASDWWPGEHALWKDYGKGKSAADWIKLYREDKLAYWDQRWQEAVSATDKWQYYADRAYTNFFSDFIVGADLQEAQLVALPKDWLSRDEAEKEFRAEWAKREGLLYRAPFPDIPKRDVEADFQSALSQELKTLEGYAPDGRAPPFDAAKFRERWAVSQGIAPRSPFPVLSAWQPEAAFQQAWTAHRKTWLDTQAKPILTDRNLRRANLEGAFFPGMKLNNARLEGAILIAANLEGADLRRARLQGADLTDAWMEGANLERARIDGANLFSANLEGARLLLARLGGANLKEANLQGADLFKAIFKEAQFSGAKLFGTREQILNMSATATLEGANFSNSAFRRANLRSIDRYEILDFDQSSFGDNSVKLPDGYPRPKHWCNSVLSDAEFFGRWRGLTDRTRRRDREYQFNRYPPIPPSPC